MTTTSNEPAPDAIVAGIHRIRKQLLDEYQGDLRAYFESACPAAASIKAATPFRTSEVSAITGW